MNSSQVVVLASFRGYKAKENSLIGLRLNKNWYRSVEESDYFLLIFDQEIRYLENFTLSGSCESDNVCLQIKDEEIVEELKKAKNVKLGLLEKDYNSLQSLECPYQGYRVYWHKKLIGRVNGYSDASQLPLLEIDMDGRKLLLPEESEYLESVGDKTLCVKNIAGLLDL